MPTLFEQVLDALDELLHCNHSEVALEKHGATVNAVRAEQAKPELDVEYEVWKSTDSCGEHYGWESVDKDEYDKAHPTARRAIQVLPEVVAS